MEKPTSNLSPHDVSRIWNYLTNGHYDRFKTCDFKIHYTKNNQTKSLTHEITATCTEWHDQDEPWETSPSKGFFLAQNCTLFEHIISKALFKPVERFSTLWAPMPLPNLRSCNLDRSMRSIFSATHQKNAFSTLLEQLRELVKPLSSFCLSATPFKDKDIELAFYLTFY